MQGKDLYVINTNRWLSSSRGGRGCAAKAPRGKTGLLLGREETRKYGWTVYLIFPFGLARVDVERIVSEDAG